VHLSAMRFTIVKMTTTIAELPGAGDERRVQQQHERNETNRNDLPFDTVVLGAKGFMAARLAISSHLVLQRWSVSRMRALQTIPTANQPPMRQPPR
jgi:hypothetical protein